MDQLRSEIRAAFEREQAAHPPVVGLRGNVVDAVSARKRPASNFQWVAVAAAVIIGVLVVVGLMSTRFHPRAVVPAVTPRATPNASPLADYGPPPAGIPLIYVHDPTQPTWLVGYDWSGKPRGTVKLGQAIDAGQYVGMAPDGQEFLVSPTAKGGSGVFLDRLGAPIPALGGTGGYFGGVWADDNRHYCTVTVDQRTFAWTFVTQGAGEAPKPVAVIARDTGLGETGIGVAACSYKNDQAVLVRTVVAWPSEMWVMQISTGKVLSHATIAGQPANLVASIDTLLTAENSNMSVSGLQQGFPSTVIHRVSDGSVVVTLDAIMGVLAFSRDNSLVLVTTAPSSQGQPAHIAVVDVKSMQIIWRYDGPEGLGTFLAEQGGNLDAAFGPGFAIALTLNPPQTTPCGGTSKTACHPVVADPARDILIVQGNGSVTHVAGRHETAW
jgi:hypothetical protein